MYRILPLLGDAGLGIIVFLAVSRVYGVDGAWGLLVVPCIFLPDLDAIMQLRQKGYVAASAEDPIDHREFLHKPILWLIPAALIWLATGYIGALFFFLVLLHFLHDSVLVGWGVPWLSPWSRIRIKFFADEYNRESLLVSNWLRTWTPQELEEKIKTHGNENWIKDLYLRPSVPAVIEYSIFCVALLGLAWSLFTSS